jgi:hypothetical protein
MYTAHLISNKFDKSITCGIEGGTPLAQFREEEKHCKYENSDHSSVGCTIVALNFLAHDDGRVGPNM